jgi:hypothetical protein
MKIALILICLISQLFNRVEMALPNGQNVNIFIYLIEINHQNK